MSIALSAFVRPSRTARLLLLAWGVAQWAAACAVASAPQGRFAGAAPLASLLAGAGLLLLGHALRRPKTHRIDISETGELRVTVQQDVRMSRPVRPAEAGAPLALLAGSVRWPGLMVLRLGGQGVRARVLPIWRDGVDEGAWRALAVALPALGAPGKTNDGFDNNR